MFEVSANIEYMFHEAGESLEKRVEAAAAAGLRKVEMFTTDGRDIVALKNALDGNGVQLWTVLTDPRTMLVDPKTHDHFLDLFRRAAENALRLGCPNVVCGSGMGVPYLKRHDSLRIVSTAFARACEVAEELGVTILLEAVNTRVDHPGVLCSRTDDSSGVARQVDAPRVKVLYDLSHSVAEGEDTRKTLGNIAGAIGHVQVADLPGRGEPGSGEIDWNDKLARLRECGYAGVIGVECHPTKPSTAEALDYFIRLCARQSS
jgi:hydroxypyruvate isomerase